MNPHSNIRDSAFRYFDLATVDLAKAREFYGGLLSWRFRDLTPEDPEAGVVFHTGAGQGGGIYLDAAPGVPGGWTPYFQVENLDATVARARRLGGEVVVPPTATPGALGVFCIIRDPCGAAIGLWQAADAESSVV